MARKYVCKIKEQVTAAMERLHKGVDSGDECDSVSEVLPGLGETGPVGLRKTEELKLIMGREIDTPFSIRILKSQKRPSEVYLESPEFDI